jgi:hypothetical protein
MSPAEAGADWPAASSSVAPAARSDHVASGMVPIPSRFRPPIDLHRVHADGRQPRCATGDRGAASEMVEIRRRPQNVQAVKAGSTDFSQAVS